jgi:hypothetical protein
MSEKIEAFWENATADDVAGIANTRKPILARVRDENTEDWREDLISGWRLSRFLPGAVWIDADGVHWKHCQVYREPSWWTDKPDPGPGYRLLEKFPDEELKPGDELWDLWDDKQWAESENANCGGHQGFGFWYRRRIEPVEPKFAVGQTVKVVEPKATDAKHWDSEMARHVGTLQTIKYIQGFSSPPEIFYGVCGIDSRSFREDYLEAVEAVEPDVLHYVLLAGESAKLPNGQTITITEKGFEVTL